MSAGCPEGQDCADDFAMHLASGQVAPEYIGCYQSYGWSEHFGNELVFYLNSARLSPDPNDPMVDRCTGAPLAPCFALAPHGLTSAGGR